MSLDILNERHIQKPLKLGSVSACSRNTSEEAPSTSRTESQRFETKACCNESKEVGDKECDNKFNVHEINHTAAEDDNQKEHQMEVEKCKENGLGHSTHASTSRVSSIAPRKANEADAAGEAVEAPTLIVPAPLVEDLIRGREIEQPSSSTRSFTSTTKLSSDLRIHFELKWLLLAEEKKAAKLEKDIAALDEDSDVETDCIKRKREDDEQEEQLKRENDEWKEHAGRLLQLVKKPRR